MNIILLIKESQFLTRYCNLISHPIDTKFIRLSEILVCSVRIELL